MHALQAHHHHSLREHSTAATVDGCEYLDALTASLSKDISRIRTSPTVSPPPDHFPFSLLESMLPFELRSRASSPGVFAISPASAHGAAESQSAFLLCSRSSCTRRRDCWYLDAENEAVAVATLLPRANEGMQVGRGGRARGGGREGPGGGDWTGGQWCVCVCVCVCARALSLTVSRARLTSLHCHGSFMPCAGLRVCFGEFLLLSVSPLR